MVAGRCLAWSRLEPWDFPSSPYVAFYRAVSCNTVLIFWYAIIPAVTSKAAIACGKTAKSWVLTQVHPGPSVEDVRASTRFELRLLPEVRTTPAPIEDELHVLRTQANEKLADIHPDLAREKI